ncbi:hypothetical protein DJ568_04345 [Mucilaginibacter hurinus]|uniref:Uncharacterized protein n=1 Tax=Mucilaginibacter hurinus TaxID=2201324 RepID=A0A367GSB0_9SPHI|nr:hypothetical protein DJ568_04345 [Mucilaginibacter hurinus]
MRLYNCNGGILPYLVGFVTGFKHEAYMRNIIVDLLYPAATVNYPDGIFARGVKALAYHNTQTQDK